MTTELFPEHKAEIDEEWHAVFDELTAQGRKPSAIKAAIDYVTTDRTQVESANKYGVSGGVVRTLYPEVVDLGPVNEKKPATNSPGGKTMDTIASEVANHLGWEEGVHYSISTHNGWRQQSTQVSLLKEGWRSLTEEFEIDD